MLTNQSRSSATGMGATFWVVVGTSEVAAGVSSIALLLFGDGAEAGLISAAGLKK